MFFRAPESTLEYLIIVLVWLRIFGFLASQYGYQNEYWDAKLTTQYYYYLSVLLLGTREY